jgi:hypothetical protein
VYPISALSFFASGRHAAECAYLQLREVLSLTTPEWITQRFDGIKAVRERNGDSTPGLTVKGVNIETSLTET